MAEKKKEEKAFSPVWLYHREHGARIFQSEEELEQAQENGWVDTPARFDNPEAEGGDSDEDLTDEEILKAVAKAAEEGPFTADGRPTVEAVEKILGRNITAEQRDVAWSLIASDPAD